MFTNEHEKNHPPASLAFAPGVFQFAATVVDEATRVITSYALPKTLETVWEINYESLSSFMHQPQKRCCPACGDN